MQDRKPLVEEVKIPQRLQDQAERNLSGLLGEATTEEHHAEMLKAHYCFGLDMCWVLYVMSCLIHAALFEPSCC